MNSTNPTKTPKVSSPPQTATRILQTLRGKPFYAPLMPPPGLRLLLVALPFALLNGATIAFIRPNPLSPNAAADMATAYAFITLISIVFGPWLGVSFGMIFNKLTTRALKNLELRVNILLEKLSARLDTPHTNHDKQTNYQYALYMSLYVLSFPMMTSFLMFLFLLLNAFTYPDGSPAASDLLPVTIPIITSALYISLAACASLICWTWIRIFRLHYLISKIEHQINAPPENQHTTATSEPNIRKLASTNLSIAHHIIRAHSRTAKFVTGA